MSTTFIATLVVKPGREADFERLQAELSELTHETEPFTRGINSIQLLWDGRRWWIMNVFWDSERPGNPIPAEFESGIE